MDLFELIRRGEVGALAASLAAGASPHARDDSGDSALMVAASVGAGELLLDAGADVNLKNDFGFDALASALWCSHLEVARRLASRGAHVSIERAAALGDLDRLEREWRTMPPLEDTIGAYLGACRSGQTEVVRWFLDRGMPVDLHPPGEEWGGIGCSGLHHAAVNGHAEVVGLLLKHGSDPTLVDDVHGSQALAWAASAGAEAVVSILLDAGAERAHRNSHGLTAADLARDNGFEDLAAGLGAK